MKRPDRVVVPTTVAGTATAWRIEQHTYAQDDYREYGVAYLIDGWRVDPQRVTLFRSMNEVEIAGIAGTLTQPKPIEEKVGSWTKDAEAYAAKCKEAEYKAKAEKANRLWALQPEMPKIDLGSPIKHKHYFKDVSHLQYVDVYRILALYNVTDNAVGHAIKKLLCAGGRGAKDYEKDLREAVDSINRALEIIEENKNVEKPSPKN